MHGEINGSKLPSVAALSYLGDARHSLYVRRMLVGMGISKSGELNERSLGYVTAKSQADAMRKIESMLLSDEMRKRGYLCGIDCTVMAASDAFVSVDCSQTYLSASGLDRYCIAKTIEKNN